ncbi:MAG: hypothetical protein AB8G96_00300 [Phycisphaerales bacterium]
MTMAICIECGADKVGALVPCRTCSFDPASNDEKARSMVASDHCLGGKERLALQDRIRRGVPVGWPEDVVAGYVASLEAAPRRRWTIVAVVVAIVLLFAGLVGAAMTLVLP